MLRRGGWRVVIDEGWMDGWMMDGWGGDGDGGWKIDVHDGSVLR